MKRETAIKSLNDFINANSNNEDEGNFLHECLSTLEYGELRQ